MKRELIKIEAIKVLLARSGNRCAFKDCDHPIFNDDNLYVANLCHIEAFSPKGPRFNPSLSNSQKNSTDNLIFLCYRHHKEVDNAESYTVQKLKQIKAEHEKKYSESSVKPTDNQIEQIIKDSREYWERFEYEIENEHDIPELKFDIDKNASFDELYKSAHDALNNIEFLLDIMDKKTMQRYFESLCIGLPNNMMHLTLIIDHMRIKYLEELIKLRPDDQVVKNELEKARGDFLGLSKSASIID